MWASQAANFGFRWKIGDVRENYCLQEYAREVQIKKKIDDLVIA
jgi:hypothetical protein